MASDQCVHCGNDVPLSAERCPHCALPGLFPNVRAAEDKPEHDALEKRYKDAIDRATLRGCAGVVNNFEAELAKSQAVIARPIGEVHRLSTSDNELYATYYQLSKSGVRLPKGGKWDVLRGVTDDALFPGYREHIRFGVLSLNGHGLSHYGECFLVSRENMIAHRATVFEENSVIFMERHNIKMSEAHKLPKGYRAIWQERGKCCIAKLADKVKKNTKPDEYPQLLLKQGKTTADDIFVEVHIWGPMTCRTFDRIIIKQSKRGGRRAIPGALQARLGKMNVKLEVV
jgi:hypothetical protein